MCIAHWVPYEYKVSVKDYNGHAFLPEWGFNGIGEMLPGKGYQLKVNNSDELLYQSNEE